jgi:Zn-finger protein
MCNKQGEIKFSRKFFQNEDCEFFPCHNIDEINCLFCFCPLYHCQCNGNYKILYSKTKDCSKCTFPHIKENYHKVLQQLIEVEEDGTQISWKKYC